MSEVSYHPPKESVTGLTETPCLVFGNGVEIETVVYAKTTQESSRETKDGRTIFVLPQKLGKDVVGTDIVKIHFLPKTSLAERANDPKLVPQEERKQIQIDAMAGFLYLAQALSRNEVIIKGHSGEDYYLLADTNPQFAAFLRNVCGFRGTIGGNEAWIKKSEFVSPENMKRLIQAFGTIKERSQVST